MNDELMMSATLGDSAAQEVAADLHEQHGLLATAAALRLNARGYAPPTRTTDTLRRLGFCAHETPTSYLSERLVRAVLRELRDHAELVYRTSDITIYCTGCGKAHRGPRVAMAKFRKCCDASTKERKHCRCCGVAISREDYYAQRFHGGAPGWKTVAKCTPCND